MTTYKKKLYVVQNDYGYAINFRLSDYNDVINLTGVTSVKVFFAERGASTAQVVGTCTVSDATNGLFYYTVQNGDFDTGEKTYEIEVEATFSSKVISGKGSILVVLPELPESES